MGRSRGQQGVSRGQNPCAPGKLRGRPCWRCRGRRAKQTVLPGDSDSRTVKFAKMAKKFPPDSAKTPGLRVTPPRMPKLQRAKKGRCKVHFRIRPLFLRTDFLKFKKKIPIDTFSRIRATKWRPLAARHGAMVLAGCPSAPGHPRASTLSTDGPRSSKCKLKKKRGGHRFLAAKKTKKLKT